MLHSYQYKYSAFLQNTFIIINFFLQTLNLRQHFPMADKFSFLWLHSSYRLDQLQKIYEIYEYYHFFAIYYILPTVIYSYYSNFFEIQENTHYYDLFCIICNSFKIFVVTIIIKVLSTSNYHSYFFDKSLKKRSSRLQKTLDKLVNELINSVSFNDELAFDSALENKVNKITK